MLNALLFVAFAAPSLGFPAPQNQNPNQQPGVFTTQCNGNTFTYESMAGYGFVPFDARDSVNDTIGGMGSSAAIDANSWKRSGKNLYTGTLYAVPDRGFNVLGTINYQPRIHKFALTFDADATSGTTSNTNVKLEYQESIFLTDPSGTPMTGLDADPVNGAHASFTGFPDLPVVHFTGDGFNNSGPGGTRVPLDAEGLVLNADGTFWISDEYGPYIYKFDSSGKMIQAIRPPEAFIPMRGGIESFSADSPPVYNLNAHPIPANPVTGRQNNQGLEGLTVNPDGTKLYALLQSALRQDGGNGGGSNRFNTRFLVYDITQTPAQLTAEYVVRLPQDPNGRTAAQSELHYLSDTQFLMLARDSGHGKGQTDSTSGYRHVDIFDISGASNIAGQYDAATGSVVSNPTAGTLKPGIVAANLCPFLDININSELNRFGVHNGGAQDEGLLNEKWESLALVPVIGDGPDHGNRADGKEYFLFALSDNDFRALDVFVNGGQVMHDTANLENQVLVFNVNIPKEMNPLLG